MPESNQTPAPAGTWKSPSPGSAPEISVIIVNWNSKDYLRTCLQSLARHAPSVTLEVIVVDGGSFDGCDEMLAREFPSVVFVQSPDNIGFARCNNLGARSARGNYLLLLNPDTEFIDASLEILWREAITLPEAGAIGCRLLNRDLSLQTSCVQSFPTALNQALDSEFLRRLFPRSSLWGMGPLHTTGDRAVRAEAISGACILLQRAFFEAVGGFTESYFMYGEDLDLSFKLTRAGHPSYYVARAQLVHFGGGSSSQSASSFSTVMMRISVHQFIRKYRGPFSAGMYRLFLGISALSRLVLICPLMLLGNRVVTHGSNSLHKWSAILRWSVGLNRQIAKPRTNAQVSASGVVAKAD